MIVARIVKTFKAEDMEELVEMYAEWVDNLGWLDLDFEDGE